MKLVTSPRSLAEVPFDEELFTQASALFATSVANSARTVVEESHLRAMSPTGDIEPLPPNDPMSFDEIRAVHNLLEAYYKLVRQKHLEQQVP